MVDILKIEVVITAEKAERGAQKVKKATDSMAESLKKAGDASVKAGKKQKTSAQDVSSLGKANTKAARAVQELAANLAIVQGPLGPLAGRVRTFGAVMGRLNPLLVAGSTALVGLSVAAKAMLTAGEALERGMFKMEAVVRATGGTTGLTAMEMDNFARSLARATLATTANVRNATVKLATFRSIGGEAFKETLRLAQDLAAAGFGNIETAAVSLGRALEDPTIGLSALRRVGVSFTAQQTETIQALVKTGEVLKAQEAILAAVRVQVGGLAEAEAKGLAGAADSLGQAWTEVLEEFAKTSGIVEGVTSALNRMAGGLNVIRKAIESTPAQERLRAYLNLGDTRNEMARIQKQIKDVNTNFVERLVLGRRLASLRALETGQVEVLARAEKVLTNEIKEQNRVRTEQANKALAAKREAEIKLNKDEADAIRKITDTLAVASQGTISLDVAKKRLSLTQQILNDENIRGKKAAIDLVNGILDQIKAEQDLQRAQKARVKVQQDLLRSDLALQKHRAQFAVQLTEQFLPAQKLANQLEKLKDIQDAVVPEVYTAAVKAANDAYFVQVRALDRLTAQQQFKLDLDRQEIALQETKANALFNTGIENQYQLNKRLDAITRQKIATLRDEIRELDKSNVANISRRNEIKKTILILEAELERNKRFVKNIFEDSFGTFFEDVINGNKSVIDSFKDMGKAIIGEVNRLVAQDLGRQLTNSLFGKQGGGSGSSFGSLVSGFVGTLFGGGGGGGGGAAADPTGINAEIASLGGAANGADFRVGGSGGVDSQLVAFKATPNERVTVTKPGQRTGDGVQVTNNFYISAPNGNVSQASQQQVALQAGQGIKTALRRNG